MKGALRAIWSRYHGPWWFVASALGFAWLWIRPWGDFPLNDDWTFAHFAKHLAEAGFVKLDAPSSPNVVGQAAVGAALTRLFGFSFLTLRLATMALTVAGLWAVDSMLAACSTSKPARLLALGVLAFNPIIFYASTTFMTELWGWMPVVLTGALWFWDRRRLGPDRLITPWVSVLVGALCGLSFWTRQICVLVYPALLGALVLRAVATRQWRPLLRALPWLVLGVAAFAAVIGSYFPWAKSTGNFRPEFAERIGHLTAFSGLAYRMQIGALILYMTAYFAPFLIAVPWGLKTRWGRAAAGVPVLLGIVLVSRSLFQANAPSDFWIGPIWTHKVFPYLVNVVWNAGVGPLTFDDTFFRDVPTPRWDASVWAAIEWTLVAGCVAWSPVGARLLEVLFKRRQSVSMEVPLAGLLLALGSTVAIVQIHQLELLDRYHLPVILGLGLALPPLLDDALEGALPRWRALCAGLALAPVVVFSVLGVHDEFRWTEARWELYAVGVAQGGTRVTIQGGYEMNCWWRYDGLRREEATCGAQCRCAYDGFCCIDDEWRLGLSVLPGYQEVARKTPRFLLAPSMPVLLSRRAR